MLKLDVGGFTASLSKLKSYAIPIEVLRSVKYLHEKLYIPLINGDIVRISDIDFNAFTLENIGDFEEYYDNTLSQQGYAAYRMRKKLRGLAPVVSKTKFI